MSTSNALSYARALWVNILLMQHMESRVIGRKQKKCCVRYARDDRAYWCGCKLLESWLPRCTRPRNETKWNVGLRDRTRKGGW